MKEKKEDMYVLEADEPCPGQRTINERPADYTSTGVDFNGIRQMHQQL